MVRQIIKILKERKEKIMKQQELKIAMRLVKDDGTFGKNETHMTDWENAWFVDYAGYQFIIDQNSNIIELGLAHMDFNSMMDEWVPADCIDPDISVYTSFLKRLVEIVEYVQDSQLAMGILNKKVDPIYLTMVALSLELCLTVKQSNTIWNKING